MGVLAEREEMRNEEERGSTKAVDGYWRFAGPLVSSKVEKNGGCRWWKK